MSERKTCGLCANDCELYALQCVRGEIWLQQAKEKAEEQEERSKD